MKKWLFSIALLLLLISLEVARVYFIMPFPGSQRADTLWLAYELDRNILWMRLLLAGLLLYTTIRAFRGAALWKRILFSLGLAGYALVFYSFNFRFLAEKMFQQSPRDTYAPAAGNRIDAGKLVIGVAIGGEAKAYPIQLIGYHHQVRDTVGGVPVLVTYCTVCRTGRVYSPMVQGQVASFRLVGMDHFNALFEDAGTKTWWRQATGEAVAGPLKGQKLGELPGTQTTLADWLRQFPDALVLQGDQAFGRQYAALARYDDGSIGGGLEQRDHRSWQPKSWVLGVEHGADAKAYDWTRLESSRWLTDSLPNLPLLVYLGKDGAQFRVWNRRVDGTVLQFTPSSAGSEAFRDLQTGSGWSADGRCVNGPLTGKRLLPVQAYQEFWHSWQTFHPGSMRYL